MNIKLNPLYISDGITIADIEWPSIIDRENKEVNDVISNTRKLVDNIIKNISEDLDGEKINILEDYINKLSIILENNGPMQLISKQLESAVKIKSLPIKYREIAINYIKNLKNPLSPEEALEQALSMQTIDGFDEEYKSPIKDMLENGKISPKYIIDELIAIKKLEEMSEEDKAIAQIYINKWGKIQSAIEQVPIINEINKLPEKYKNIAMENLPKVHTPKKALEKAIEAIELDYPSTGKSYFSFIQEEKANKEREKAMKEIKELDNSELKEIALKYSSSDKKFTSDDTGFNPIIGLRQAKAMIEVNKLEGEILEYAKQIIQNGTCPLSALESVYKKYYYI